METSFTFKGITVRYDSAKSLRWIGIPPDVHPNPKRYFIDQDKYADSAIYFEAFICGSDFDIVISVIEWIRSGFYELNPNVLRGDDFLKTLHQRVRVIAKRDTNSSNYLSQLRISKLKMTQPVHSNLFNSTIQELNFICEIDTKEYFLNECTALRVDTLRNINEDNGHNRNSYYVLFQKGNFKLLIAFFLMTRVFPILKRIHA